jgi:hypothetical protein
MSNNMSKNDMNMADDNISRRRGRN